MSNMYYVEGVHFYYEKNKYRQLPVVSIHIHYKFA